jgi:uncharacterized phiE125 gp8 family phage protein
LGPYFFKKQCGDKAMAALLLSPLAPPALSLEEVHRFCRLETTLEDGLIQSLIATATDLAEQATGQILLQSQWQEVFAGVKNRAVRLGKQPIKALLSVRHTDQDGIVSLLERAHYTLRHQPAGGMVLELHWPINPSDQIEVIYTAGLAQDPQSLSAGLRHALLRTVALLFAQRDSPGPHAANAAMHALWQPYRQQRLN